MFQTKGKEVQRMNEYKTSCFAYLNQFGKPICKALTKIDCKGCKFYKLRSQFGDGNEYFEYRSRNITGKELRQLRGDISLDKFARMIGTTDSTLLRNEKAEIISGKLKTLVLKHLQRRQINE